MTPLIAALVLKDFLIGLAGLAVVVSAFAILVWRSVKKSDDPLSLAIRIAITLGILYLIFFKFGPDIHRNTENRNPVAVLDFLICVFLAMVLAILWTKSLVGVVGNWFGNLYSGGNVQIEPKPYYSIAQTSRQKGEFMEAIRAIRGELVKFPDDVEGQLLLADIQAADLKDLQGAELTIQRFCSQETHAPQTVAAALNTLADYHLKLAQDVDTARGVLEDIQLRYPNTDLAQRAAQRIAHLGTAEEWTKATSHERDALQLKQGVKYIGLLKPGERPELAKDKSPEELAEELATHLHSHPHDNHAREQLAMIYAEHFHRVDLAAEQLEELIAQPEQPAKHVAQWLHLLAFFHVKHGENLALADAALVRIQELFPGTLYAEQAAQRRARLKNESHGNEKTEVLHLGAYEKDLGLKMRQRPAAR